MSESSYREIIDLLDDALFVHALDGSITAVNAQACRLFGRTRDALLACRPDDLLQAPLGEAAVMGLIRRARDEGPQRFDVPARRGDGGAFTAEVTLKHARLDGAERVLALVRDVTAVRRTDEALRESRAILEKAQEVGQMGSWVSGLGEDRSLTWSRETYRIFGVGEGEPVDVDRFFSLVHADDREAVREAVDRAVRDQRPYAADHRVVRADGTVRWIHERADLMRDAAGRLRLVGVCQDVTDRRETEEQLRQAAKMEAVGRLAGGVAHDFNNMLTAIAGYADLALMQAPPEPLAANLLEVKAATTRAAALTRQLMTFGRRAMVQVRVIDLNATVGGMAPMLRRLLGEDVELVTSLEPDLGRVRAAPDQMEQVLLNLVVNARDALPRGGAVTIETRDVTIAGEHDAPARDGAGAARPHVLLQVCDTGVGMDGDVLARCFEPFFTTKERGRGTGLGLATVYGIVQQAGGQITVRSAPEQGTSFRIYLPRVDEPVEPGREEDPAAGAVGPRGHETVLLVEDDDRVRALAERLLGMAGYVVLGAAGAREALARADAHAAPIHLLLTDVVMPQLGGRELHEELARRRPGVRVLFMSGYTDDALVAHRVSLGEHRFLQKPFSPAALLREVRAALEAPPLPAG